MLERRCSRGSLRLDVRDVAFPMISMTIVAQAIPFSEVISAGFKIPIFAASTTRKLFISLDIRAKVPFHRTFQRMLSI